LPKDINIDSLSEKDIDALYKSGLEKKKKYSAYKNMKKE
jgi:hypothetical protein